MPPNYRRQEIRAAAAARAAKMMKLFSKPTFENIMETVDPPGGGGPIEADFRAACGTARLDPAEIDWLWAYLKECPRYDVIPDAAMSGW